MHNIAKQYIRSRSQGRDDGPRREYDSHSRDYDQRRDYGREDYGRSAGGSAMWAMAPWMEAGRYGGQMPDGQGWPYDGYRGREGYSPRSETGGYREHDRRSRDRAVYVEGTAGRDGDDQWRVAGRMTMPHGERGGQLDKLDEHTAKEWVSGMQNADGTTGPHWTMEQTKQVAAQKGVTCDPLEFWIAMNMVYSDYFGVAKKFNINNTDFYVELAKAFLDDKDAGEGKLARYYEFVAR